MSLTARRPAERIMWSNWLPRSVALRAVLVSTVFAAISLFLITLLLIGLFRQAIEDGFEDMLSVQLGTLLDSVSTDDNGIMRGEPAFSDSRFLNLGSGWYWTVEYADDSERDRLMSRSLGGTPLPFADPKVVPFSRDFRRSYSIIGPKEVPLQVFERESQTGSKSVPLRYRIMGDRRSIDGRIGGFTRQIYTYLSLFVLLSIAANVLAVRFGLRPLRVVSQSLKQIREGKSARLEGEFPPEIAPLANEMNALIDNNRRIVERSRTQVGNLAHALKTPLAVMSNEGQALGGVKGAVIAEQTAAMQDQIQRYLQRARIGAQRESVVYRAPITPIIAPTLRTMQKLNPEKQFSSDLPKDDLVFAGEGEDFQEIIGNILENAAKWGRKRIVLKASKARSPNGAPMLSVEIGDDGKGLTEKQIAGGIKRGKRLDESKPGTGLGLSIVSDTVREYGGEVKLGKSSLGGLSVTFTLPLVE
jgi:signal transduction histidine kinase